MSNVTPIWGKAAPKGTRIANSGEPPYDGGMEARVAKLEADITAIKIDVAVIKANGATKSDIAETKAAIIMWVAGIVFLTQLVPSLVRLAEKYI